MNKKILLSLLLSMSCFAWGERFQDHVHSIEKGKEGEEHILKLSSGRVIFFNEDLPPHFGPEDFRQGERLELEVDSDLRLKSLVSLPPLASPTEVLEPVGPKKDYHPTILPDYPTARKIFNGMNRSYKRNTECSDRAQIWAYEEWKKHDLYSNKAFVFFTNTYIRRYRFYWWFHVAPYVLVKERGEVIEHVMDKKYTSYPYHMKQWTDIFVRSKRSCPVKTYAYYRANKNGSEHCVLVKAPMYYRLPLHVRNLEDQGIRKTRFSTREVNFSYRAFSRRGAK